MSDFFRFDARDWRILAALTVLAMLMFLPFLGTAAMFDPTDSFFIEAAREMLETGKMVVPMINYEPWLDKPALAFWLIIGCYKIFGVNEFAGRLPSALSGIALVLTTFALTRQVLPARQALLCALVLCASPLLLIVGHVALTDVPLALFLTTTLLSIAIFLTGRSKKFLIIAYVAMSLAVLTKGPVAIVLVGLITLLYLAVTQPKQIIRSIVALEPLWALGLLAVLALPYYIWAHVNTNGDFTNAFFIRQNLGRVTGSVNHVNPFWWYIPVALGGFFPWSINALFSGKFLMRLIKNRSKNMTARQRLTLFSALWGTLGFLFFSAIPTKLHPYILPIFPALAIVAGIYLDVLLRRKANLPLLVSCVTMVAGCAAFPIVVHILSKGMGLMTLMGYASAVVIAVAGAVSLILYKNNTCRITTTLLGTALAGFGIFLPLLFCLYHDKHQSTIDDLVAYAKRNNAHFATVLFSLPSTTYQYKEKVPVLGDEAELQAWSDEPGRRWILVYRDVLSCLSWTKRSPRAIGYSGKYWLFAIGKDAKKDPSVEWNGPQPEFMPSYKQIDATSK